MIIISRKPDRKETGMLLEREPEMLTAMKVMFEGIQKPKLDAIAVTMGPGLEPALWVGINGALALNTYGIFPSIRSTIWKDTLLQALITF
jgi:hypothetical protein